MTQRDITRALELARQVRARLGMAANDLTAVNLQPGALEASPVRYRLTDATDTLRAAQKDLGTLERILIDLDARTGRRDPSAGKRE